ncbi:MAG: hemerythrin domain-containing protein, partial [Stellaceae bacterium]
GAATTTEEVVAQDPIALLSADHRKVEELFGTFEQSSSPEQKIQLAEELCTELVIHALLEEEIFYPACKGHMDDRLLNEAQVEHDGAKTFIVEVQSGSLDDPYFEAKVKVLADEIKHHVTEEERPNSGIFAKAVHAKINTADMAKKLGDRKKQLLEKAMAGDLGWPETRSFRVQTNVGTRRLMEENSMARNSSSSLERDERGRFVNDDDEREDRRRSSGRSRSDVDEDRRPSRSRDEDGRFTSSRSRSRDDDDDDRGRGQRAGSEIVRVTRRPLAGAGTIAKALLVERRVMTMMTGVPHARGTTMGGSPARARAREMMTMMTGVPHAREMMRTMVGVAAAGMVAGSAIPKVMLRLRAAGADK